MQDRQKHGQAKQAVVAAAAALGIIAGFGVGYLLAIPLAEYHLARYLSRVAMQDAASMKEARDLLAILQHSSYPPCSDAELGHFRELVFRSEYLKDAGRIHGGRIECSATVGRPLHPIGQFTAAGLAPDGTVAYTNLVPIRDESLKRAGLQLGSAFIVFGSHLPEVAGSLPIHVAVRSSAGSTSGSANGTSTPKPVVQGPAGEVSDGVLRKGDMLVATHCSSVLLTCVTASVTTDEARQGEMVAVACTSASGCIAGAFIGAVLFAFRRRHISMEQQLRRAVAEEKLQVVYQPIVDLVNGKIVGAEALSRWKDRDGTQVSPDKFIKVAEENGFIGPLTSLVFRRALSQLHEVLTKIPDFKLDINVTAADLADPTFLPMLDEAMKQSDVRPSSVVIEVTESSTANQEVAMEAIRLLRRRGHGIYIDDFGTGYSSLSYLTYLSVDRIKIDKAFTRAIGTQSPTMAILPPIMAMARSLNLGVVVEGVETEQQALYFTVNDTTIQGQGYLYGEPLAAEQFLELMEPKLRRAAIEGERQFAHAALGATSVA
jgi:sensor c-di-GMP phosphodiesterase-like protein